MTVVSVTDLILNFVAACRALVPALDFAQVPHRDDEQYDNWDRVSVPLFQTLVTEPCVYAAVGEMKSSMLRVPKYGDSGTLDRCNAFFALCDAPLRRFVELSTVESPFDYCEIVGVDTKEAMPVDDVQFVFVFVAPDGTQQQLATVDLEAV